MSPVKRKAKNYVKEKEKKKEIGRIMMKNMSKRG